MARVMFLTIQYIRYPYGTATRPVSFFLQWPIGDRLFRFSRQRIFFHVFPNKITALEIARNTSSFALLTVKMFETIVLIEV